MISVLIPAYNVEKYINEALTSIINQTIKDIEIIIVDDCSSDHTYKICSEYSRKDNRIKLFRNKKNSGIADTLNTALNNSIGEYIVRMDADDISLPHRIETMYDFLLQNPSIDIVGSSTITIDENGKEIGIYTPLENHKDLIKTLKWSTPLLHIWMCKKEIYNKIGNYRFPPVEDYDFLLRCVSKGLIIHNIIEPLYKVRIRSGNTADLYGFKQIKSFEIAYKAYKNKKLETLDLNKIQPNNVKEKLYQLSRKLYFAATSYIKSGNNIRGSLLLLISAMLSSYQLRYIYRRLMFQLYKKKSSK
ncbi:glycosyltransferase family 2 protein [Xenorhabdus bovienii]|uniref:glycosyltransferase family 2 protein n=1 Tax=Xenorhabdus bovienii TaxID=40576 RepID=UPI003DA2B953